MSSQTEVEVSQAAASSPEDVAKTSEQLTTSATETKAPAEEAPALGALNFFITLIPKFFNLSPFPHDRPVGLMLLKRTNEQNPNVTQRSTEGEALEDEVRRQIEYYLSREYLASDPVLVSQMNSEMYFPISTLAALSTVKADTATIVKSLRKSTTLSINASGTMVKPNFKLSRNTVILRDIPTSSNPEARFPFINVDNLFGDPFLPSKQAKHLLTYFLYLVICNHRRSKGSLLVKAPLLWFQYALRLGTAGLSHSTQRKMHCRLLTLSAAATSMMSQSKQESNLRIC